VLHDQPGLSEAGVAALGAGLSRLRCLTLRQCDQVRSDAHLPKIFATHRAQGHAKYRTAARSHQAQSLLSIVGA
jgi:hypothetical protein